MVYKECQPEACPGLFRGLHTISRLIACTARSYTSCKVWVCNSASNFCCISSSIPSRLLWIFLPTGHLSLGCSWKWNRLSSGFFSTARYTSRNVISVRGRVREIPPGPRLISIADNNRIISYTAGQKITGNFITAGKIPDSRQYMYSNGKFCRNLHISHPFIHLNDLL